MDVHKPPTVQDELVSMLSQDVTIGIDLVAS